MSINTIFITFLMMIALLARAPGVDAAIVTPDSAATTVPAAPGFPVEETIDGITAASDNGFVVDGSGLTGSFDFGFDLAYDIYGFELFNDAGGSPFEGISLFDLHFYDSSSSLISSVFGLATDPALRLAGPDTWSFPTITGVSSVTMEVLDSYDESTVFGNELAFREVRFDGLATVPLPAASWLFLSGLLCVVGRARGKRRNPLG